jgi:hypothetical protein
MGAVLPLLKQPRSHIGGTAQKKEFFFAVRSRNVYENKENIDKLTGKVTDKSG